MQTRSARGCSNCTTGCKVDFPVYALFTKADLVAGFMEYFGDLGENGRKQVWGATFQTDDKTRNMVGEVPVEFDALIERLNDDLTDRLQEEPAPSTRVALFGFPAQMAALKRPIFDFLNPIFEPTRYHANATLRGFYFTSGTQEGTPIDQLIGALARSFGAEEVAGAVLFGPGQELLPDRSDQQGDHRRGRLGFDRSARGAARPDHEGGRLYAASLAVRRRRGDRLVDELQRTIAI